MTEPPLTKFPPVDAISAEKAYGLIAQVGIREVIVYPACDEIVLKDGYVLRNWGGGYEYPRYWTRDSE